MPGSRVALMPCAPYDIDGVERWVNAQARQGWRVRSFVFLLPYLTVLEDMGRGSEYHISRERPTGGSSYSCRMPFVFHYLVKGRPPRRRESGEQRQMTLNTILGMLALPLLFAFRGLGIFSYLPAMFADPSLFSLYPAFTAVLAVSAAAILAVVCSVLYTMVCAVTERAGRASGKCYMISQHRGAGLAAGPRRPADNHPRRRHILPRDIKNPAPELSGAGFSCPYCDNSSASVHFPDNGHSVCQWPSPGTPLSELVEI